jgi:hypothetical protein
MSNRTVVDHIHAGIGFLFFSVANAIVGGVLSGVIVQALGESAGFIDPDFSFGIMLGGGVAIFTICLSSLLKGRVRNLGYAAAITGYALWLYVSGGRFEVFSAVLGVVLASMFVLGVAINRWLFVAVFGAGAGRSRS